MDNQTVNFELPKLSQWHPNDFFAINLRQSERGLTPTGRPRTVSAKAGKHNVRLRDGRVLSVGDNGRQLTLDGKAIGSLRAPFAALIDDGDGDMMLFTQGGGCEWLGDGCLHGSLGLEQMVTLSAVTSRQTAVSVGSIQLKGSYPRGEGKLTSADTSEASAALTQTLDEAEMAAHSLGQRIQPCMMAWRMIDSKGQVMASGGPRWVGAAEMLQGACGCEMAVEVKSGKAGMSSEGTLEVTPYGVVVSVCGADSQWLKDKVARLEILATPPVHWWNGAYGSLTAGSDGESTLTVAPREAPGWMWQHDFGREARVVCVIERPLEGTSASVDTRQAYAAGKWADQTAALNVTTAYRAGTAVVYGAAATPGTMLVSSSAQPLSVVRKARVANGRIWRILAPRGGNGGWNYGRQHLLVFASDGIYAVSISSDLLTVSSSLLVSSGVARADAVTEAHDAIYAATIDGRLLRFKGSRCTQLAAPIAPRGLCYCTATGELWICGEGARTATVDSSGRATLRTDLLAVSMADGALAVDTSGALRSLADEEPVNTAIRWHRRIPRPLACGICTWPIDTAGAAPLTVEVYADSGGSPTLVTSATLRGEVNAPLSLRLYPPRRTAHTHIVSGMVSADTHLGNS